MLNGTKYRISAYSGAALLLGVFAFVSYAEVLLAGSGANANAPVPTIAVDVSKYEYIFVALVLLFIPCMAIASMFVKRVYVEAVGKVFEITRARSTFKGFSRFEGIRIAIQTPEQIAVGDRVKTTGYEIQRAGRARVLVLKGNKLAPGDSEYDSVFQPGSLNEQIL